MACGPGSLLGGLYRILELLGRGGHGTVWLARQERTGRLVAVKEIADGRLVMEAEILKTLSCPGLPAIVDILREDSLYLVMEYIKGQTLLSWLEERGPLSEQEAAGRGIELCRVLSYLHERKPPVIYRDLKPSNIMVRENGSLVLIDFGTAREQRKEKAEDTVWLGTRGYAAPEQYGGQGQTGPETDIYGLGAVLFQLLTGKGPSELPYCFPPLREVMPGCSEGMERILAICTRTDPRKRYRSCKELAEALARFGRLVPEESRKRRRQKGMLAVLAGLALLTGGGGLTAFCMGKQASLHAYRNCLFRAEGSVSREACAEACRLAVRLEPGRPEAYCLLLKRFVETDGRFSPEEERLFREVLELNTERGSALEVLKRHKSAYGKVAYETGMAYFYDYEGSGGRRASAVWLLDSAKPGTGLSEQEAFRAGVLGRIAEYYDSLGRAKKSGEKGVSYGKYWEDLISISFPEAGEKDNLVTALVAARELTVQLSLHGADFLADGVSREAISESLTSLEEAMREWEQQAESRYEKGLLEEVEEGLILAEEALGAALQGEKKGKENGG